MKTFWSDRIKELVPYLAGEQPTNPSLIKLNANENPYPPSPEVLKAISAAATPELRIYPSLNGGALREALADRFGLQANEVFLGNGSDEILAFCFPAFFNPDKEILFPDITYSFYPVYAAINNQKYRAVPLADDFSIPVSAMLSSEGGVIFPNPNAPTGIALALGEVEEIIKNNPNNVVIVDEAYIDFGGESAVCLINKYPNLLVIHTFSKSRALAGLRVAYAMGNADLIAAIDCVKNSFNSYTLDRVALAGGKASLDDEGYFESCRRKVIATRERVSKALRELGFKTTESRTNFVFASHESLPAKLIFEELRRRDILVRHFNLPRIDNHLRISIGTDQQMDELITQLKSIIETEKSK